MADVQYWKDSIITEIEQVRAIVSSIPNKTDELDRTTAIAEAEKKVRSAKGNCRSLKAEIRIVADPEASSRYKRELSNYEQSLSQITADIQALKSEQSKNQLFLGANTNAIGSSPEQADPVQTGDALLTGAENIQDKTQVALNNTVNMIAESKQTGMLTLEELERQRNAINNVENNVIKLEDHLARADRLIKTFGKRMATDKLIQCFACVNIVLIVGVVIYSLVKGGMSGDEEEAPESPVDQQGSAVAGSRMLRGYWQ